MPTRTANNRRPKNSHRRLARRKQARRQRTALAELLESRDAAGSMLLSLPGFISLSPLTSGTARASLADAVADATGGQHKANAKALLSGRHSTNVYKDNVRFESLSNRQRRSSDQQRQASSKDAW